MIRKQKDIKSFEHLKSNAHQIQTLKTENLYGENLLHNIDLKKLLHIVNILFCFLSLEYLLGKVTYKSFPLFIGIFHISEKCEGFSIAELPQVFFFSFYPHF